MDILLIFGLLLACGVGLGAVANAVGLPRVVGYLLAGLVLSKDLLGNPLGIHLDGSADAITAAALGVIAYLIAGSFSVSQLKSLGWGIPLLTATQLITAFAFVSLAFIGLRPWLGGEGFTLALLLGAIACTTAPAAIVAVVHEYRSSGPVTTAVLGVVALDDALGIVVFALVLAAVGQGSMGAGLMEALVHIVGACIGGATFGALLGSLLHRIRFEELRLPLILGAIILVTGLARQLEWSPLLAAMSLGFTARLTYGHNADRLFRPVERIEDLTYILFFALAGLHFDAAVIADNAALIAVYVAARFAGKCVGAWFGVKAWRGAPKGAHWIGLALIPQAGVALAFALIIGTEFHELGRQILNIVLGATVIHELAGPVFARMALVNAGEVGTRRKRGEDAADGKGPPGASAGRVEA